MLGSWRKIFGSNVKNQVEILGIEKVEEYSEGCWAGGFRSGGCFVD